MLHTSDMMNSMPNAQVMRPLAGKVAIVTGSTSGIGLGIASAFASAGAALVLNGFGDRGDIAKPQTELETNGVPTAYSPADMSKPDDIMGMVEMARQQFGKVDILVNNAGIQ